MFSTLGVPEIDPTTLKLDMKKCQLLFVMNMFLEIDFPPSLVIMWLFHMLSHQESKVDVFL